MCKYIFFIVFLLFNFLFLIFFIFFRECNFPFLFSFLLHFFHAQVQKLEYRMKAINHEDFDTIIDSRDFYFFILTMKQRLIKSTIENCKINNGVVIISMLWLQCFWFYKTDSRFFRFSTRWYTRIGDNLDLYRLVYIIILSLYIIVSHGFSVWYNMLFYHV